MMEWKIIDKSPFAFITQLAFWVVVLFLISFTSIVSYGWQNGLVKAAFIFICHFLNFYIFYWWLAPVYFEKKKYVAAVALGLLVLILLAPIRLFIETIFTPIKGSVVFLIITKNISILFIIFSEMAIASFAILLKQANSNEEKKSRIALLNQLHLETELNFLKGQISPHFLFNAINNIYSLTLTKSNHAPTALMKLSDLLRYMLYETVEKVAIDKEISLVKNYKELFQLRYEESLNFSFEENLVTDKINIEPFLLLPIIENAFKHSAIGVEENAFIKCAILQQDNMISIVAVNSKPLHPLKKEEGGIGLSNIKRRLTMVYPGKHDLKIDDAADTFTVSLRIPVM